MIETGADVWTGIITAITLMLGGVLSAASGFLFYRRQRMLRKTWPLETGVVRAMVIMMVGLVFFHIALSRLYHDDRAYHIFDLNSGWTAAIRFMTLLVSVWWVWRLAEGGEG